MFNPPRIVEFCSGGAGRAIGDFGGGRGEWLRLAWVSGFIPPHAPRSSQVGRGFARPAPNVPGTLRACPFPPLKPKAASARSAETPAPVPGARFASNLHNQLGGLCSTPLYDYRTG